MAKFSSEQIKGILAIRLMKFFTSSMERLENKIESLSNENVWLKQEVESLKTGTDFENKWFEEAKRDLEEIRAQDPSEEDIKLLGQKHQQLEEKILCLKIDLGEITYGLIGLLRRQKVLKRGKKVRI